MKKVVLFCLFMFHCFIMQAIDVVFRFDDFRLAPDSLQDQLLEVFYKNDIPISLAVVPCSNDTLYYEAGAYFSMLQKMDSNGVAELALHGLNHRFEGKSGEFSGVPFERQFAMISKGKHILDSLFSPTVTFIPPWNSYDDNTLKALEELGLKCISSCMTIGQPLTSKIIAYYPETIDHPSKLMQAIDDNRNRTGIIILMFHHYDFTQSFTMEDMDVLLKSIKDMNDVECYTFRSLCDRQVNSDEVRFKANIEINLLSKVLRTGQMLQTKSYAITIRVFNLLIYMFIVLAAFVVCRFVFGLRSLGYELGWGIILILTGNIVWWHVIGSLKALMLVFVISISYIVIGLVTHRNRNRELK